MTIDEAIAHAREVAEMHRNDIIPKENYHNMPWIDMENELNMRSAEEHEQLAEWLEELKALREEKSEFLIIAKDNYEMGMENGYNKALDDFIHECDKHCGFYSGKNKSITREDILKIAEYLKEMTENDRE